MEVDMFGEDSKQALLNIFPDGPRDAFRLNISKLHLVFLVQPGFPIHQQTS